MVSQGIKQRPRSRYPHRQCGPEQVAKNSATKRVKRGQHSELRRNAAPEKPDGRPDKKPDARCRERV